MFNSIIQDDFVGKFLYSTADIASCDDGIQLSILMDSRMEGWIGIPHGGISMGIFADLAMALENIAIHETGHYPVTVDYRLAGAGLKVNDVLDFHISKSADGVQGEASVGSNPLPYMSATIRYGEKNEAQKDLFSSYLPSNVDQVLDRMILLPFYRKCFVCGTERDYPGLRRQFHLWDTNGKIVVSFAGFDEKYKDSFYSFHRGHFLHPLPTAALLDETLGWAGFMRTAAGAVTVQISMTYYRPVSINEKLIFFGRGERVRGNPKGRLLYWASGGAAAVQGDGSLEVVASASGQWFAVHELTEQMKTALLPEELMVRAFELAKV
ncbi:MAG: hypothetical protein CSYNP_00999 [Syntrophus sp. SKADARSKE-3]|nr:hypothetical protein [Syntrophus sp. SKADARSKE-3]